MKKHVGIILVSYNAPQAVIMTLDSLVSAKGNTPFSVVLIDNGSSPDAERQIAMSMNRHLEAGHFQGRLFLLGVNKGFSGGNNIGITYFLSQPDITHFCLLNTDVVVSDHWLDYLLEDEFDAVGPLTNASNNEQGIPVPYMILRESDKLSFDMEAYQNFAAERHSIWKGLTCSSSFISFFCAILSRSLVQKVGYLDTRFHPGAYEDDDYCVRILENNFIMHVRRDVFLHHWGSASFSELAVSQRQHHGMRNKARFVAKYQHSWQDRTHLSWRAWIQDALFAIEDHDRKEACRSMLLLYESAITKLSIALDARYARLALATGKSPIPASQNALANQTKLFAKRIRHYLSIESTREDRQQLATDGATLETFVKCIARACDEMESATLQTSPTPWIPSLTHGRDGVERIWSHLQHIENGVVFFAGYPFPEKLKDGYFQRVAAIDNLLPPEYYRIYCDVSESFTDDETIRILSPNTIVLQVRPDDATHQLLVSNIILRCKKIYYHSILRTLYPIQRMWLSEKQIKKFIDVHGVVPEEFIYCSDDYVSSAIYSEYEEIAMNQCHCIVTVSDAMQNYLEYKYTPEFRKKMITLPIFQSIDVQTTATDKSTKEVKIVYAGGAHPWQCIPRMLETTAQIIDTIKVDIFATDPDSFLALTPQKIVEHQNFRLMTATHEELCAQYPLYDYGFLLREDVAVNRVACPTKLVEYLAYGVVPILDSDRIGDFVELGIKYLHVDKLKAGLLLSQEEHAAYILNNFSVLDALKQKSTLGARRLQTQLLS